MQTAKGSLTLLLDRWTHGESEALEELFQVVYPELQRMAGVALRKEWSRVSWQRTELANEVFVKLFGTGRPTWENRAAFFSHAVLTIRRILIAHSRNRKTQKRWGQAERVPFVEELPGQDLPIEEAVDISMAIDELKLDDPRGAVIVELRFFLGLKIQEIARLLDVSPRTVERDFEYARACLRRLLAHSK